MGYASHPSLYRAGAQGPTVSTSEVRQAARGTAPPQLFTYQGSAVGEEEGFASTGAWRASSLKITAPGQATQVWTFDARSHRWRLVSGGPSVLVANLVVQNVPYKTVFLSRKFGLTTTSARVIGSGSALILSETGPAGRSAGAAVKGTWSKPGIHDVTTYLDANNRPVGFQHGTTWVILAPPGTQISTAGAGHDRRRRSSAPGRPFLSPWSRSRGTRRPGSWLARHPAWPVTLLLAGIPLWWALGFGDYIFILLAIPMAARLYAWSAYGNRKIRVPPGFALWLLFLLVVLLGVATLSATAPGTLASPVSNRLISFGVRTIGYLGATALLLFVGNLTERELPRRRLAWLLGLVGLYTVAGGLLGVFFTHLHFTAPLAAIVPHRLQANNLVLQAQLHPAFSQLQSVLGTAGRPTPPSPTPTTGATAWPCCCPG